MRCKVVLSSVAQVVNFGNKLEERRSDRKIAKFLNVRNFQQESWISNKSDHCQLPVQKMRLEENNLLFLRNTFIRLQKEIRSLPRQLHSNCNCSCKVHSRVRISVSTLLSIRYLIPGKTGV